MLSEGARLQGGLRALFLVAGVLVVLRIGTAYFAVPPGLAYVLSILATIVFVAWPILAIFRASSDQWTPKLGFTLLAVGVILHAGGVLIAKVALHDQGLFAVILIALAQSGLLLWCVALGALLAMLMKDQNILVPVAVFLAGLDMFLVLAPIGIARQIVEKNPEIFQSVAYSVPKVATGEPRGVVVPLAYVGPADFFFLAMFFVALYRFNMRTTETLRWIVPVLLAYLAMVILLGGVQFGPISLGMLPALVPIGLTVLIVNRDQFKMNGEEKAATAVVGLIAVALAIGGIVLSSRAAGEKAPQAEPSTMEPGPAGKESADSIPPLSQGPPM